MSGLRSMMNEWNEHVEDAEYDKPLITEAMEPMNTASPKVLKKITDILKPLRRTVKNLKDSDVRYSAGSGDLIITIRAKQPRDGWRLTGPAFMAFGQLGVRYFEGNKDEIQIGAKL